MWENLILIGLMGLLIVLIFLSGCRLPAGVDPEVDLVPGEPGDPVVIVEDARSDGEYGNWMAQYIIGGAWADTWFVNQYERPFSADEMVYQPYLDIKESRIRPAGDWTVFEVLAVGPASSELVYISLELDTDLDNRPDLLILTQALEDTTWNDLMISLLVDPNRDAGGNRPRLAEPFQDIWNGFEESYNAEESRVYIRRSPDSDSAYQIAVLNELLEGDQFVWRVWLEGEIFHPGWVEYNDRYSLADAGSPYRYSPNYPLKALASLDNTCLQFFGGQAYQPQPGFCETIIDLSGEETLPPDDQFSNPSGENPVSIIFPSSDPGDGEGSPDPTLMVFDPGYFFQPTQIQLPHLNGFPTMEFVVPAGTTEGIIEVFYETPVHGVAIIPTPPVASGELVDPLDVVIPATEMFDPYQGSSPTPKPVIHFPTKTPTEMFDPYQGSSPTPTPKPIIHFPTKTPTATDRPIIILKTATPTP